ncbi:hypothetical protein [Glycocaulis sp.]|uniref:hypothetical protein n=1 Tax=Glycocaulis sp. TaxID=1969725 RepID=UPI003D1B3B64
MLRLLGAILVAGMAVLAAALGAASLLDARATEGGRELAAALATRDVDTAARPLVDCNAYRVIILEDDPEAVDLPLRPTPSAFSILTGCPDPK